VLAAPVPSSAAASAVMRGNRRRDTRPEVRLRSLLHRQGLRFRVDLPIAAPGGRPIRADVAFTRLKVAVFVDGCFWHGCPEHGTRPQANASYWAAKLARNAERDRRDVERLEAAGWTVVRLWEHESVDVAAATVLEALPVRTNT
jgi:DNA mismatch endonuclease (patch repair protein)